MDSPNYRMERIERLLHELEHEIVRGMMEGGIDEHLGFRFYVPISKRVREGVVLCEFHTIPVDRFSVHIDENQSRLRVIEGGLSNMGRSVKEET